MTLDAVEGHGRREPEVGGVTGGHTSGNGLSAVHRLVDQTRGQAGDAVNGSDILLMIKGLAFIDRGNGRGGVIAMIKA